MGSLMTLVAVVSPLDALADQLFFRHMVQHILLLDIIPILGILGLTKVILRPLTRPCTTWSAKRAGSPTRPSR